MEKRSNRTNVIRRKRKRIPAILLGLFLSAILLICTYAAAQYYSGKEQAGETLAKEDFVFNGKKDSKGRVNILLIGADRRGEEGTSNSDSIMIAQYDGARKKAKLISLMRDMYTPVPGYETSKKINAAYLLGGPELLRETIKENFDIDLQYYVLVDFKGFENVIDAIAPEGVEINVEKPMRKEIGVSLQEGKQQLNGKELLGYARFRQDAESDFGRVRRQQQVIKAVSKELISTTGLVKAPKLLGTIQPYIKTNIGKLDSLSLIKDFMFFDTDHIDAMTVPVKGSFTEERLQDEYRTAILRTDFEENADAIRAFLDE